MAAKSYFADKSFSDQAVNDYRKAVVDIFDSHYTFLNSILQESMSKLAEKAFEAGLISKSAASVKNYDHLATEFTKVLELSNTTSEVQTHCEGFLKILKDLGGPAANAAEGLGQRITLLTELLTRSSQYGLSHEELKEECDNSLFIEVSQHMDDYIKVGQGLHLSSKALDDISQSKKADCEKKTAILWAWKRENGTTATARNLIEASLKMNDLNMAEAILRYLSKKTASEPPMTNFHLAPEKAKDSYPNWEDLTMHEKEVVRNKLMDENHDVRKAYAVFVTRLIQSFRERKVNPRDIQLIISSIGALDGSQNQSVDVFNFCEVDSITDVFYKLSRHCTWFNYELFQFMVEIVGDEYEKQYLKTYEDHHLIPYLKRSIFEIPFPPSHSQSQRTNLFLKISADLVITGNEVKSIQQKVAQLLGFESALIHFANYNEGCIELVFSLPTLVVNDHFSKSTLSRYFVWEQSRNSFKVNVDVITLLYVSETPEKLILLKLLQEKEDSLEPCIMMLRSETMKYQVKEDNQHMDIFNNSQKQSLEYSLKQIKTSEDLYKTGRELKNNQLQNVAQLLCF